MFASVRQILGVVGPDVEQALAEQYGRAGMQEQGRSQGSVTYLLRVGARSPARATILPNAQGVTLQIEPHVGALYGCLAAGMVIIGLFVFVLPGILILSFLLFKLWMIGKVIGGQIDNVVSVAEHQAKMRLSRTNHDV